MCNKFVKVIYCDLQAVVSLGAPHVDSFNFFLGKGLQEAVMDIPPLEFALKSGTRVSLMLSVSFHFFAAVDV